MNVKDNKGFSLVELLVAIAIMAAFVIPTCSAFVLTARMNNKTDEMMQAQLAVSSAVETLMAKGIVEIIETTTDAVDGQNPPAKIDGLYEAETDSETLADLEKTDPEYVALLNEYPNLRRSSDNDRFSVEVFWIVEKGKIEGTQVDACWYTVTAISKDNAVKVSTSVRIADTITVTEDETAPENNTEADDNTEGVQS